MLSNRFAFAALATLCITAAAAGGYFATRQNAAPIASPTTAVSTPIAGSPAAATSAERPVAATDAVDGDKAAAADSGSKGGTDSSTRKPSNSTSASGRTAEREVPRAPVHAAAPVSSVDASTRQDPPLDRTPPAFGAPASPSSPLPAADGAASAIRPDDRPAADASRASEPPAKTYDELVIAPDSVLGLQIERTISTSSARVEDRVDARVTRDVRVGDKVAIPSGARAIGSVTEVERGGKLKDRARLGIRFHTLVLVDGTRVPMSTETIYRDGDAPTAAQKMGGGAVAGAILGAILGGAKGAAIGSAAGAGAGAAAVAKSDPSEATFPAGTQTTVRILSPVTVTVER